MTANNIFPKNTESEHNFQVQNQQQKCEKKLS